MKSIKQFFSKEKLTVIKYVILVFVFCLVGFSLLRFPDACQNAVSSAIEMCLSSVIPSLYPFMIVSSVIVSASFNIEVPKIFEKISYTLFRQPGISLIVIALSQTGGFPVGAALINQLYKAKRLSKNQCHRLLLFCINPGPAFVISFVGKFILSSQSAGIIIYISVVMSSLLIGIFSRFFAQEEESFSWASKEDKAKASLSGMIVESVKKNTLAMAEVCGWIITFSCINSIIGTLNMTEQSKIFVCVLLEVTNACKEVSSIYPIEIIAGVIGWSGLCVHFQLMNSIINTSLKLKYFYVARVINSAVAILVCKVLLSIFPVSVETANIGTDFFAASSTCIPVSIGLIMMSLLILLGDKVVIRRKN